MVGQSGDCAAALPPQLRAFAPQSQSDDGESALPRTPDAAFPLLARALDLVGQQRKVALIFPFAADLFYRPSDGRVTVDRPDRDRGDRTYTATPASRKRVLSLMQGRFWPTLMGRTPDGFWTRTNRITRHRRW